MLFNSKHLYEYISKVLQTTGLSKENSDIVSDSLIYANLRGVDSHGVTRLPIYMKRLTAGAINKNPEISVVKETKTSLLIDGDNSMGQVVGNKAIDLGVKKAKKDGGAFVGINNSNHFGSAAYFIQKALNHDMIAFAMSNAPSTMAPWGGVKPYFGTNPYAFGFPTLNSPPIILDMATSIVARGKIIMAAQKGEQIPHGWAIDNKGNSTTNAQEALDGTVLPFGGPKGYAISLMIDILSGVLTGAGYGTHVNNIYGDLDKTQNVGHFFKIINIDNFMNINNFKNRLNQMVNEIKNVPAISEKNEIFLPGEIEYNTEQKRKEKGIPIDNKVYEDIKKVGENSGIDIKEYHY